MLEVESDFAQNQRLRWVYAISRTRKMQIAMSIRNLADTNLRWKSQLRRVTCPLVLAQIGVYSAMRKSFTAPKWRFTSNHTRFLALNLRWKSAHGDSRATYADFTHIGAKFPALKIAIHEQPAHWFWHRLPLKFSHFSPKWRFTSNYAPVLKTASKLRWNLITSAMHTDCTDCSNSRNSEQNAHWFWQQVEGWRWKFWTIIWASICAKTSAPPLSAKLRCERSGRLPGPAKSGRASA